MGAEQIMYEKLYDRAGARNGPEYVRELEAKVRFLESINETARLEIARLSRCPLTGAFGRGRLDDLLGLALARSVRGRYEGAGAVGLDVPAAGVLFIDVDGLKPVNDIDGHPAGDAALAAVARAIHSCLRAPDSIVRYGGDEFVVIVDQTTPFGLLALADRITAAVRNTTPVTVSIGGACHELGETAPALIARADRECYRAKRLGKDRAATSVALDQDGSAFSVPHPVVRQ